MKQYTYIAAMVMSVCGAYAAVDGEHLNYKLDDFRNYFCGSWGGSAKDILTYCNNMGIRHVGYSSGMENLKEADGMHFYMIDPEYETYKRTIDFKKADKYTKEEIYAWEHYCALKDANAKFPNNLATGWFFTPTRCSLILDYQQQRVIDRTVNSIVRIAKGIQDRAARNGINFKLGGYHWDVPQPTGDFYGEIKGKNGAIMRRQVEPKFWTGVDSLPHLPGVIHDFDTFSEGRLQFYKQLRLQSQKIFPNVKLIMDPAFCWEHWQEHIEKRKDIDKYRAALPDFITEEFKSTNYVDDPRVFKSGLVTKDMMATSTFQCWYDVKQELIILSAGALNEAWSTFFGHMGIGSKNPCDVPARLKLSRYLATWENLNNTPLSKRHYDAKNFAYSSPTFQYTLDAVAGVRPGTNKMLFVFITPKGKITVPQGYKIAKIRVLDKLFTPIMKPLVFSDGVFRLNEKDSKVPLFRLKDGVLTSCNNAVLNDAFMAELEKTNK